MPAPTPPSYTPGDSYPVIPVPGFTDPLHTYGSTFGDAFHAPAVLELLASTKGGWRERGAMLAPGQGIIPTGTVIAQYTAAGVNQYMYGVYSSSASDPGLQIPVGFLRNGVDTGGTASGTPAQAVFGLVVDRGVVNYQVVSGLDANAITKLVGRLDNSVGYFYF
jgi:hypothetical protein